MSKALNLQKEYAFISMGLYKGVEQRVDAVVVAMSLISLCVHHRASLFGYDEQASANYIFVTHQMAADLTASIAGSLSYAYGFDYGEHKDLAKDNAHYMATDVNTKLNGLTTGLIKLAENGEIIQTLIPDVATGDKRDCFVGLHEYLLEIHDLFNAHASDIKARAAAISESIKELAKPLKHGLSEESGKLRLLEILCTNQQSMANKHKEDMIQVFRLVTL